MSDTGVRSDDDLIRGYDPEIVRRLIGYLRPYIGPVIVAVFALLIGTAADLMTPVVLQRTIDGSIIVTYRRVRADSIGASELEEIDALDSSPNIGAWVYVREDALESIDVQTRSALISDGVLDSDGWYLFEDPGEELRYVLQLKSGLFELDGSFGAIRLSDLDLLSREERRLVRSGDIAGVSRAALLVLGLLMATLVFSFAQVYLMAYVGQGVMKSLRLKLFDHVVRLRLAYLQKNPVGGLVTRVSNDVETLNELFSNVATALLKDVCVIVGVVVTMLLLDSRLAFVAVLTVPPVVIATAFFRVRARTAFRQVRSWVSRVNAFLSERISGMAVVQMFAAEERSTKRFDERSEALLEANLAEVRVFATFRPLVDLFTSISVGVVLFYGAGLNEREFVSLGVLIAFINLIGKFYRPIQDISEKFTVMQSAMAGGERVFALLDTDDTVPDEGTCLPAERIRGAVGFSHVEFAYNQGEPIIRDLSFEIEPGEKIAVVGYTGAGKTTLINLITRMWDIQSGSIMLDGVDIRSYPLSSLRSYVQAVQQDVFLFSGTVAENIGLGRGISRDAIVAAAEAVSARGFIESLNHGFDTVVQESGANLSTGQRQLISFARVLAGDPRIVVLDEATSSVDTETERLIQRGLDALLAGRTSITIAHRLSTIRHADRILVLAGGRLLESGSHEQLLDQNGAYATLYRYQYAEHERNE